VRLLTADLPGGTQAHVLTVTEHTTRVLDTGAAPASTRWWQPPMAPGATGVDISPRHRYSAAEGRRPPNVG